MNEKELTYKDLKIDDNGIIMNPGKFEGELYYVYHFWQTYLDSGHDEETENDEIVFALEQYEKEKFPELSKTDYLLLFEDVLGFVYGRCLTKKMYKEEFNV